MSINSAVSKHVHVSVNALIPSSSVVLHSSDSSPLLPVFLTLVTSVISDNNTKLTEENMKLISDNEKLLGKLKFNQTALLEENHNLTEHNNRLS